MTAVSTTQGQSNPTSDAQNYQCGEKTHLNVMPTGLQTNSIHQKVLDHADLDGMFMRKLDTRSQVSGLVFPCPFVAISGLNGVKTSHEGVLERLQHTIHLCKHRIALAGYGLFNR